jgi:glycosyltransferase involved in cell wall biosynthesis
MSAIITVVIPVYNGEKYVHRAVESVVNQPVKEAAEVLIVNDGSTDQSGKACDLLAQEYPNVHVIHKENGGVSSARNLGIQNVTTKYIAFLDCDDWWEPGFLDQSMIDEFSSADSADVYQFAYQTINNNCSLVLQHPVLEETLLFSQPGLGRYDWNHHCSFVFSHELLKKHFVLYPIDKVGEDGSFLDMALVHAKRLKKETKRFFHIGRI